MKQPLIFLIFIAFFSYCSAQTANKFFYPGQEWVDNNGVPINAHGGGVTYKYLFNTNSD